MSEMHDLIVSSTEKILKDFCTKELLDAAESGEWSSELWDVLVESGITLVGIPEENGGVGGDYVDAFHILREAGKYAAPVPLAETLIVNWLLSDKKKKPNMDPVTFSSNGSLTLTEKEGVYTVNGTLQNVAWARFAKKALVKVVANGKETVALISLENANIDERKSLGGEPIDKVSFEDVTAEVTLVDYSYEKYENKLMQLGALARATMMSGAMERILDLSLQYANEREQFGRPLFKLQAIQQLLAVLAGQAAEYLAITNKAIDAYQEGNQEEFIAYAKIETNKSANKSVEIAHQIHGAIGATYEHRLHHYTRRIWTWRDEFGKESYWKETLVQRFVDSEQSLWSMVTD